MGMGFSKMKKQAKMMQEKMMQMQQELKEKKIEGSAANDLVQVVINGEKEIESIKINPECIDKDDVEGLQDLIKQALKNAYDKIEEEASPLNSMLPF